MLSLENVLLIGPLYSTAFFLKAKLRAHANRQILKCLWYVMFPFFAKKKKKGSHATFPFFLYFCSKVQRYQFWIPRDDPFVIAVGVWLTEILMTKYYKSCYCLTLDATTTRSIKSTGLPLNNSWWNRKGPTTSSYERRFLLFFLNQQCNGKKVMVKLYKKQHSVWKSLKKSHSIVRAKRATFTYWVKCQK